MKFKNTALFFSFLILTITSCRLSQESKFYSDKSSSAEIMLRIDPSINQKLTASKDTSKKIHGKSIKDLPTDWVSFYDLGLKDTLKISEGSDTAKILKSIFIKYIIENGQFAGFGMKAERLKETNMLEFGKRFNMLNPGKGIDSMRPANALDPKAEWDGKTLTLKFNDGKKSSANKEEKKTSNKDKKKSNDMFMNMFKDANIVMTYRYSFEKKIVKIKGKHDFLTKVDDHKVVYELDFKKLMKMSEQGKSIRKKDPVIVIKTE